MFSYYDIHASNRAIFVPSQDCHTGRRRVVLRRRLHRPVGIPPCHVPPRLRTPADLDCSISSILNSRFLLALHETNARLEGADLSMSVLSIDIDGRGDPIGDGTLDLPSFLGSINDFDDGDVRASLVFARPEQDELQPELVAEDERGRDAEEAG